MELSEAEKQKLWSMVEEKAKARRTNGLLETADDEVNFFCGAMSAIYALTGDMKNIPSNWVFGLMGNRRVTG